VSCAETDEPIDLSFGLWTRKGRRKHKFNRIRQVCPPTSAHWRYLANAIEQLPHIKGHRSLLFARV